MSEYGTEPRVHEGPTDLRNVHLGQRTDRRDDREARDGVRNVFLDTVVRDAEGEE